MINSYYISQNAKLMEEVLIFNHSIVHIAASAGILGKQKYQCSPQTFTTSLPSTMFPSALYRFFNVSTEHGPSFGYNFFHASISVC